MVSARLVPPPVPTVRTKETAVVGGAELRRFRRDSEVTVTALAQRLGFSRQTTHNTENAADVDLERAQRFMDAVRDVSAQAS